MWWQCTPFLQRQQQQQHTAAGGKGIPMAAAAMQKKLDMKSHNTHSHMQLPQQEKPQEQQQQQQQQQQPHKQQGGDAVAHSRSTCATAISGSTPKRGSTLYNRRHKAIVTSIKVKIRSSQIQRQSAGSAQASGSSSGGEAVAVPAPAAAFQESAQLVQKAITAAMQSLAKKGQLQHVVHTACTCFPGCVHAINSLTADTDLDGAEQHELEQQATEAAVEELSKIGDIQAAAVLAMSGSAVPYLSSSSSSPNGPASADYWSLLVQPIALAVPDMQQYAHDTVPVHLSLPKGAVALTADAMVQTDAVAIRVVVTCSGSSQVLFDGSWTAEEAFSCGGALMLQLPVALLQRCLAVVTVLLPAASSNTASYSDVSRTTDGVPPAHAERRHGMNEAVLAQLPLLLLPHEAAEEVQCLFAAMAQEAGSCAAAYNQHFVPFAQDMALALAYSKALAGHEWSAEETRLALLAYMHYLPVAMPSCLQLLQDMAMAQQQRTPVLPLLGWQAADGSSSAAAASLSSVAVAETEIAASSSNAATVGKAGVHERSVIGNNCNTRVSSGASNVSSTSMATRDGQQAVKDAQLVGHAVLLDAATAAEVRLRDVVLGFDDAALEQQFMDYKNDHSFNVVMLVGFVEVMKDTLGMFKAAAIVAQHPETLPWALVLGMTHASLSLPYILMMLVPRMRQRREGMLVMASVACAIEVYGFLATEHLRQVATIGFKALINKAFAAITWRATALPIMQQLTVRNHVVLAVSEFVTFAMLMWMLLRDSMPKTVWLGSVVASSVSALVVTTLTEWRWRRAFLQHARQQRQQAPRIKEGMQAWHKDVPSQSKEDTAATART